jgi:hypothetical protein
MKHFDDHPQDSLLPRLVARLGYHDYLTMLSAGLSLLAQEAPLRRLGGEMFRRQKLAGFDLFLRARVSAMFARFRK